VSGNKKEKGNGDMTPGIVVDRCAVMKGRREVGDVTSVSQRDEGGSE
jgi:hypothetical protein